jgi:hypothetical protein
MLTRGRCEVFVGGLRVIPAEILSALEDEIGRGMRNVLFPGGDGGELGDDDFDYT